MFAISGVLDMPATTTPSPYYPVNIYVHMSCWQYNIINCFVYSQTQSLPGFKLLVPLVRRFVELLTQALATDSLFYFIFVFLRNPLPPSSDRRITQWGILGPRFFWRPSSQTCWPVGSPSFCCGLLLKPKPRVYLPVAADMPFSFCRYALGVVYRSVNKKQIYIYIYM